MLFRILSVTELSLPKKRCKTCRNRFHASCLFKVSCQIRLAGTSLNEVHSGSIQVIRHLAHCVDRTLSEENDLEIIVYYPYISVIKRDGERKNIILNNVKKLRRPESLIHYVLFNSDL